ncbi:MAG: hypothetical protein E7408_03730 [Ruminococcaceae bacterium]|nr:hypothetical protein [Oscillospiraceae bacterium]
MNVANVLTVIRISMIPFVAWMFAQGNFRAAAIIFFAACFTDVLDGYIARRFHMITDIGKLLDPLADKGMQLTVLISLAFCRRMPFAAVVVILAKEILMFVGGLFLYRRKIVVSANWYGKAATVLIAASVMAVLLFYDTMARGLLTVMQWLPVVVSVTAFLLYLIEFIKTVREGKLL